MSVQRAKIFVEPSEDDLTEWLAASVEYDYLPGVWIRRVVMIHSLGPDLLILYELSQP